MTELVINRDAWELGLHGVQAWILDGLQAPMNMGAFPLGLIEKVEEDLRHNRLPADDGYQKLLAGLGYPDTIPAAENMRRLVQERGLRRYGLLIDAVNVISLQYGGGIGLHDVGALPQDKWNLRIQRASGTERIQPSFSSRSRTVPAGDLIYGADLPSVPEINLFAWLGAKDCDAEPYRITEATAKACLVVLGHAGTRKSDNERIGSDVIEQLTLHEPDLVVHRLPLREPPSEIR